MGDTQVKKNLKINIEYIKNYPFDGKITFEGAVISTERNAFSGIENLYEVVKTADELKKYINDMLDSYFKIL